MMKGQRSLERSPLIVIYVPLPNLKRCRVAAEYSTVPVPSQHPQTLFSPPMTSSNPFWAPSFPLNRLNLETSCPVYQGPLYSDP